MSAEFVESYAWRAPRMTVTKCGLNEISSVEYLNRMLQYSE